VELVVSGSIRTPDESDALSVELSLSGSEIVLDADGSELGRWDSTAVVIRQIDATEFEFIAEGDRLIFLPDDPAAFGIIPFGGDDDSTGGRRKGRRAKPANEKTGGSDTLAASESPPRTSKPDREPKAKKPKKAKPAKPPKVKKAKKPKKVKPAKPPKVKKTKEPKDKRSGVWLRTLDTARRHDFLGLDRVPVDVKLRGGEHEHTWDHRVAATSGVGKHICTLCGKIRR
jgi:hypothetical protein